jgi:hypothetical protein
LIQVQFIEQQHAKHFVHEDTVFSSSAATGVFQAKSSNSLREKNSDFEEIWTVSEKIGEKITH